MSNRDFDGAEALLEDALGRAPDAVRSYVHLQFGRLYREWNKLTSAIDHLNRAAEVASQEPFLRLQILDELKLVKARQLDQRP